MSGYRYKLGTEYEQNSHAEVIAAGVVFGFENLVLKIGGPDARHDLFLAAVHGIGSVIAPMVESVYAVEVFATACEAVGYKGARGIMLETLQAWSIMEPLFEACEAHGVGHVTIGRSDLAGSMQAEVEDLDAWVQLAYERALAHGLDVSVGGQITPGEAEALSSLGVEAMNTRHVYFTADGSAGEACAAALREEAAFLARLAAEHVLTSGRNLKLIGQATKRALQTARTREPSKANVGRLASTFAERKLLQNRPKPLTLCQNDISVEGA